MSVILDALRRQRRSAPPPDAGEPPGAPRQVPAGLGLGQPSPHSAGVRSRRTRVLGVALLLVIGLGAWAAVQVARTLIATYTPPASSTARQPPVEGAPAQTSRTAQVPPPPSSVSSGAPMTLPTPDPSGPRANGASRQAAPTVVLRSAPPEAPESAPPSPPAAARPEIQDAVKAPEPEPARPREGVNHFELAIRYQRLGDYDQALKHYLAVLAEDEFHVEARNNLGLLYHQRGQSAEAIEQFRRALAVRPQYGRARSNLAVVLMEAGRLAEARAELRAAMTVEPRNADLFVNLALVEKADRQGERAIELLLRALGYEPGHAMAHYNLGVLYEEQGAAARAYDHYTEFLRYAGPERGELLSDVRQRLQLLGPKLGSQG